MTMYFNYQYAQLYMYVTGLIQLTNIICKIRRNRGIIVVIHKYTV